jgi:hypothetical protein
MVIALSANLRDRSFSSRWRSQPSIRSSTRKEAPESPSHDTEVKRSGFFFRAFAFGQLSSWIVMPLPGEM